MTVFLLYSDISLLYIHFAISFRMIKSLRLLAFSMFFLFFLSSCKSIPDPPKESSVIRHGTSKLTGNITFKNEIGVDSVFVKLFVPNPVTGAHVQYSTLVDRSGNFDINVNLELDTSLIGLYTSLDPYKTLFIQLTNGGVTNVKIDYGGRSKINHIDVSPKMNVNDVTKGIDLMTEMTEYKSARKPEALYTRSTDYFLDYAKTILAERLKLVDNYSSLSDDLRSLLSKDMRLFLYTTHVLDYQKAMALNYHGINGQQSDTLNLKGIDRSYFRFLKDFKLNDPQYLKCFTFSEFQMELLQNETLGLPVIAEQDISSWLAKVKSILGPLVGFKSGIYYEVLAANAYGRQLKEEAKPLTEKQLRNISKYWKTGEIAKILLRKNEEVIADNKRKSPPVVNEISSVPEDKVIETILSKYKNKVILIDLWATWCQPCLNAMDRFKAAKGTYLDKDVVFVYVTNTSSPYKLWNEKIKGIGNEHYYLSGPQWVYLMEQFQFDAIPSYLLYNKKGELVNKFTAFPENKEVTDMIDELL